LGQNSEATMFDYTITRARPTDLRLLTAIEIAAARLLIGHAPAHVLNETTSEDELDEARRRGRLWVALAGDAPVGFAHVKVLEPTAAHLEEIDVHPDHSRRGIGTRLIAAILAWAADAGYRSITLTTFRDVPWNMRYYARLGFRVISPEELNPTLRSVVEDEARRGLDPSRRVVMRCTWPR
jgi:GNAT superfamily N-acetyltransferase